MGPPTEASHLLVVSDLLIAGTTNWNKELIRQLLPVYEKDILLLKPSLLGAADRWAWLPTSSGLYAANSGYFEALKETASLENPPNHDLVKNFNWRSNIWGLQTSPKTKLLLWKAGHEALPVGSNLLLRHISDTAKCPRCEQAESTLHLFFHCSFARRIWDLAPFSIRPNFDGIRSFKEGLVLANTLICLPPTGIGSGPLFPWLLWTIWTAS